MTDYLTLREPLLALARRAGDAIMAVYGRADFGISHKDDQSPLTAADTAAHRVIHEELPALLDIPMLSEEGHLTPFEQRRHWPRFWLIDPLDGTREFIARTDEFTVNIALIEGDRPVLGVVHLPVGGESYLGIAGVGAWKYPPGGGEPKPLQVRSAVDRLARRQPLVMLGSRRHAAKSAARLQERLQLGDEPLVVEAQAAGSSLKFCRIAEGQADIYPRLGDTSEWDTAAAQAVLEAAGGILVDTQFQPLRYNRGPSLLNPHFYALGDPGFNWQERLSRT